MRLTVDPDVIALAPGDVTDLLVRVHNDGEDTCTPHLQVRGIDPDDVLLPDVVAVPAGSMMTAVVRVRAAADAIPGDRRIAVAAEDLDGSQRTVSATTVLRIGARPDVAVEVDPVATVGRRGAKARTVLRNRSDRRLQVVLEGRGEGVRVAFRPSRVTLDPGETRRVPTRMRRAQRSWFGEIRHGAVITARGIGAPASTTATFTQKPSIPRPAVRGVAALTALAVWVAATVVVFNRINAEPEAGPDSTVLAAPAAPGPGRTSATGMFEEEVDDGVRLPVVIQGTIGGPRELSGTTVTAERIGFGDQGTTTGLTKVVALAEVKLPRGNVLDVVRTTTDERGRFRIASGLVEEAFYRVTAVRAGFEVGSFVVSTSSDQPEVTLTIALEPAVGSLAGIVTDIAGGPVGGATVVITDGSVEYTTVTPSEGEGVGRWMLEGLATPATYQVLVSRRGFAAQTLIVELDGGQKLAGVDAVLKADLGTVVGRITDANPEPNQPGVAQGVGALTVTLAGPEARETRTLTVAGDLRGTFDLPGLPFGDYVITFAGEGWETRQAEVRVDRGLVRLDATIDRSTGLVQGWVWQVATGPTDLFPGAFQGGCRYPRINQRDGDGATGSGTRARPCGGVAVTVESDEGDVFATATATETGFFQIGGVPAGQYRLTLSRPGFVSDVRAIVVQPGGTFNLNDQRTVAVVSLDDAVEGRDFVALGLAAPPSICAGSVILTLIDFRDGSGVDPVTDASAPGVITVSNADECDPALIVSRVGTSGSYLLENVPLGAQTISIGDGDDLLWAYAPTSVSAQVTSLDRVSITQNIVPRPRTLTLPAGTIRLDGPTGADRDIVVEVINAAGANVGPVGGTVIPVAGNGSSAPIDLELVGPDRDLRLRAVGGGSPARGYATVTSASFELPAGLEPFELPLLTGSSPRLTVTAATTVTGTIFGFTASPLTLSPLEGATVTFPAQSGTAAEDTTEFSVTTGADGTFRATVRAGTYLQGATVDRTTGTFGEITVAAANFAPRVFNPSGSDALALTGVDGVLRDGATGFFLLYGTVGGATSGDVGLDPAARDVLIPVSLLGAAGASRTLSAALSGGTVLEGATARPTPTPTPTPPAAVSVSVGPLSNFTFAGVRPGDYTLTVSGDDAVTETMTLTVPVGMGMFGAPTVEVVATTTVTGAVFGIDHALNVVAMPGATVEFPSGSADGSAAITSSSGPGGAFTAIVRSGAYTADGLGAVTVTPSDASHVVREFEATFVGGSSALRTDGAAFLLNPSLSGTGSAAGDIVLSPAPRSTNVTVSLDGAATAVRDLTVTLTNGVITGVPTSPEDAAAATGPDAHPTSVTVGEPRDFLFVDVAPGEYLLTISGENMLDVVEHVVIAPGVADVTVSRDVQATVRLSGTLTEAVDPDLDASGFGPQPVPGATVTATEGPGAPVTTTSQADGTYSLTVRSGTWAISAARSGYATTDVIGPSQAFPADASGLDAIMATSGGFQVLGSVITGGLGTIGVVATPNTGDPITAVLEGDGGYRLEGLVGASLWEVTFTHVPGDGSAPRIVTRWIDTSATARTVSVRLDQDLRPEALATLVVSVANGGPAESSVDVDVTLLEGGPFKSLRGSSDVPGTWSASASVVVGPPEVLRIEPIVPRTLTLDADARTDLSLPSARFTAAGAGGLTISTAAAGWGLRVAGSDAEPSSSLSYDVTDSALESAANSGDPLAVNLEIVPLATAVALVADPTTVTAGVLTKLTLGAVRMTSTSAPVAIQTTYELTSNEAATTEFFADAEATTSLAAEGSSASVTLAVGESSRDVWVRLKRAGATTITATFSSGLDLGSATAGVTVEAAAADTLEKMAGDGQTATAGTAVAVAPQVRVTDAFGNPVSGVTVTFTPAHGTVAPASVATDDSGLASTAWTLDGEPKENTLTAAGGAGGLEPVTFTATGELVFTPTNARSSTGSIQTWTVPSEGNWTFTVAGAQGGSTSSGSVGGRGAIATATFLLAAGTTISILTGAQGPLGSNGSANQGGGGGSFIWIDGQTTPFLVAGGGGGAANADGLHAVGFSVEPVDYANAPGSGSVNWNRAAGWALDGDPVDGATEIARRPLSATQPGRGGTAGGSANPNVNPGAGGFGGGGGGAGEPSSNRGAGGGGGYLGGVGQRGDAVNGGGGSSFVGTGGTSPSIALGPLGNAGDGRITIVKAP